MITFKSNLYISVLVFFLSTITLQAQIKNAVTQEVKISGNCGMCKKTIEKAGTAKNVSKVIWDSNTQLAQITYDKTKTSKEAVLKQIALSGYDNEEFLAPNDTYNKLHECCLYERDQNPAAVKASLKNDHSLHLEKSSIENKAEHTVSITFEHFLEQYLLLKDAFVASDAAAVNQQASVLLKQVGEMDMKSMKDKRHQVWMKQQKNIQNDLEFILKEKKILNQRIRFANLSTLVVDLAKAGELSATYYYQKCPMFQDGKGAAWISKVKEIKNPYYGSQMMTCGSVIETLK